VPEALLPVILLHSHKHHDSSSVMGMGDCRLHLPPLTPVPAETMRHGCCSTMGT
jgi:hypothetical protein